MVRCRTVFSWEMTALRSWGMQCVCAANSTAIYVCSFYLRDRASSATKRLRNDVRRKHLLLWHHVLFILTLPSYDSRARCSVEDPARAIPHPMDLVVPARHKGSNAFELNTFRTLSNCHYIRCTTLTLDHNIIITEFPSYNHHWSTSVRSLTVAQFIHCVSMLLRSVVLQSIKISSAYKGFAPAVKNDHSIHDCKFIKMNKLFQSASWMAISIQV